MADVGIAHFTNKKGYIPRARYPSYPWVYTSSGHALERAMLRSKHLKHLWAFSGKPGAIVTSHEYPIHLLGCAPLITLVKDEEIIYTAENTGNFRSIEKSTGLPIHLEIKLLLEVR